MISRTSLCNLVRNRISIASKVNGNLKSCNRIQSIDVNILSNTSKFLKQQQRTIFFCKNEFSEEFCEVLRYLEIHDHLDIDYDFVIPSTEDWPSKFWGYPLGKYFQKVYLEYSKPAHGNLSYREVDILHKFIRSPISFSKLKWLLEYYRDNVGKKIDFSYTIPAHSEWPKYSWDLRLGAYYNFRKRRRKVPSPKCVAKSMSELELTADYIDRAVVLKALHWYRTYTDSTMISQSYIIPSQPDIPSELHGLELGAVFAQIRDGDFLHLRATISDLGYDDNVYCSEAKTMEIIEECQHLITSKGIAVEMNFEFCSGDSTWPRRYWGHVINRDMKMSKLFKFFPELRRGQKVLNEDDYMQIIRVYMEQYPNQTVSKTFCVPSRPPWPRYAWGLNLNSMLTESKRSTSLRGAGSYATENELIWVSSLAVKRATEAGTILKQMFPRLQKVHYRFQVPFDGVWPPHLRGLQLGRKIYDIKKIPQFYELAAKEGLWKMFPKNDIPITKRVVRDDDLEESQSSDDEDKDGNDDDSDDDSDSDSSDSDNDSEEDDK